VNINSKEIPFYHRQPIISISKNVQDLNQTNIMDFDNGRE